MCVTCVCLPVCLDICLFCLFSGRRCFSNVKAEEPLLYYDIIYGVSIDRRLSIANIR